jgi:hypothetical protein
MIWDYDNVSRRNAKLCKICTFWKNHIYLIMINTKHDILGQLYVFSITSCKRFHSKIILKKMKRIKKGLWSFYKVIPLAPLSVCAPKKNVHVALEVWSLQTIWAMVETKNMRCTSSSAKCIPHTCHENSNFLFILSIIISLLVYGNKKIMLPLATTILHQTCCLHKT